MYHLYHVLVQYAVHKSGIGKIKYNWPIESKLWFSFSNIFKKRYLNNNKHNKTVTLNLFCWFCNLYARIVIQTVKWNFDQATERPWYGNTNYLLVWLMISLSCKRFFATINKIFLNKNNSRFYDEMLFVIAPCHSALYWRPRISMTYSERIISICVAKHAWLILAYSLYLRKSELDLCTDFNS